MRLVVSYISKSTIPRGEKFATICRLINHRAIRLYNDTWWKITFCKLFYKKKKYTSISFRIFLSLTYVRTCVHVWACVNVGLMHTCTSCRHARHVRYPPSHFSQLTLGDFVRAFHPSNNTGRSIKALRTGKLICRVFQKIRRKNNDSWRAFKMKKKYIVIYFTIFFFRKNLFRSKRQNYQLNRQWQNEYGTP